MRVFTAVLFLGAFLALIEIPEKVIAHPTELLQTAQPFEVWHDCGTPCENTCDRPHTSKDVCVAMCKRGYFCDVGYIRETRNGRCIPMSECPAFSHLY